MALARKGLGLWATRVAFNRMKAAVGKGEDEGCAMRSVFETRAQEMGGALGS